MHAHHSRMIDLSLNVSASRRVVGKMASGTLTLGRYQFDIHVYLSCTYCKLLEGAVSTIRGYTEAFPLALALVFFRSNRFRPAATNIPFDSDLFVLTNCLLISGVCVRNCVFEAFVMMFSLCHND
jgi:hypothetical protein